jgi:hypothetical protein
MGPGSAAHHFVLRSIRGTPEVGNFCRHGINCRGRRPVLGAENPYFIGFLALARRLLIPVPST